MPGVASRGAKRFRKRAANASPGRAVHSIRSATASIGWGGISSASALSPGCDRQEPPGRDDPIGVAFLDRVEQQAVDRLREVVVLGVVPEAPRYPTAGRIERVHLVAHPAEHANGVMVLVGRRLVAVSVVGEGPCGPRGSIRHRQFLPEPGDVQVLEDAVGALGQPLDVRSVEEVQVLVLDHHRVGGFDEHHVAVVPAEFQVCMGAFASRVRRSRASPPYASASGRSWSSSRANHVRGTRR